MAKNNASKSAAKALTKTALFQELADSTKLTRKQVAEVFDALTNVIAQQLGKKGPGSFTLPGMAKLKLVRKPATKARKGINPFTKQEQMFPAKPARNTVRIRALKALNEKVK